MSDQNRTVGEILRTGREEKGLSLEEISLLTKVRVKYLSAIEADNWDIMPSSVQQKGFVRSYARVLELDPVPLLSQLRSILQQDDPLDESAAEDAEDPAPTPVQHPLEEIGSILKNQRERLGFTIASIEEQIFIPERYLVAIENGSLEELPSTVQGKGMVKNYAQFLGLDPEPLMLNYADVLQKRLAETRDRMLPAAAPSPFQVAIKRFLASPTILWIGVVILIGSLSVWAGTALFGPGASAQETTEPIPGVSDILLPSSTPSATLEAPVATQSEIIVDITPSPGEAETPEGGFAATATPGITGNEKVQVQLIISQRTWVRVTVDNILAFEGRLVPGSVKLFGGELSIEVLTGNASGVEIIYNQQDLGAMGLYGEVVDRVFTAEGIATPTPTITTTPTPSNTPQASSTPTPTATLGAE